MSDKKKKSSCIQPYWFEDDELKVWCDFIWGIGGYRFSHTVPRNRLPLCRNCFVAHVEGPRDLQHHGQKRLQSALYAVTCGRHCSDVSKLQANRHCNLLGCHYDTLLVWSAWGTRCCLKERLCRGFPKCGWLGVHEVVGKGVKMVFPNSGRLGDIFSF